MTDHEDPTTEAGLGPMMDGPHTYKMDAPIDVTNWTVIRTTRDAPNADGTAMESRDEWWHVPTFVVEAIESEARATAPTGLDAAWADAEAAAARIGQYRVYVRALATGYEAGIALPEFRRGSFVRSEHESPEDALRALVEANRAALAADSEHAPQVVQTIDPRSENE